MSPPDAASAVDNPPQAADTQLLTVVVVGAGQMGSGIAQVFSTSGHSVRLVDVDRGALDRASAGIRASVAKLHGKGLLDDTQAGNVENVVFDTDLERAADADLAVEAASERVDLKLELFARLDAILPPAALLTSNTSSIPISRLAAATSRPGQVAGMHFMNPPALMRLVEVVSGLQTDPAVTARIMQLARSLGKVPVHSADSPGFITNRLLMPLINQAFACLAEGIASAEDIDTAMQLGMNHPMGPLALADLIGLDTCLSILEVIHHDLGDATFQPSPLLRRHVEAGRLGRKAGRGVFEYGEPG